MNLLIKNENNAQINLLSIDIIKTFSGVYNKNDIANELHNFYYNKVIIDITAISNYYDITSVLDFLSFFDKEKIVILLNESELINSKDYLGALVKNGYYNFSRTASGISYLLDIPNKFEDVQKYAESPVFGVSSAMNSIENEVQEKVTKEENPMRSNVRVIGIQSLTEHAGATTLMYMLVKHLSLNYSAKGIEMFTQDSIYFHSNDLNTCVTNEDLKNRIKTFSNVDVVFVDLNGLEADEICDETIYLVEPGVIRLNKLIKSNTINYDKVNTNKVILNRSTIADDSIKNFTYETKLKVFYNLKNLDERRERILDIDLLLIKLGFNKQRK